MWGLHHRTAMGPSWEGWGGAGDGWAGIMGMGEEIEVVF